MLAFFYIGGFRLGLKLFLVRRMSISGKLTALIKRILVGLSFHKPQLGEMIILS